MARVWGVVTLLGLLVVIALAVRTGQGWAPTERERWRVECGRGQLSSCAALGDDLLYGRTGPVDRAEGMSTLDDACTARSAASCAILGGAYLNWGERERAEPLLRRGCELRSDDACAHLGSLELSTGKKNEGLARLRQACGQKSGLGCSLLGERGINSRDVRPEEANAAFARGCSLGNTWSCFRNAQALVCGRGVKSDPQKALPTLRELCAGGSAEACSEQVDLETDGGVAVLGRAHTRAIITAAFGQARLESIDSARQTLSALDGGVPFAVAAIEVSAGNLEAADVALARAPVDQPEARLVREVLRERREGTPWPDAVWLGWKSAGEPDLRESEWVRTENFTRRGCSKAVTDPIETEEAFVRAVAETQRTRLDARFDAPVVHAAMRYAGSDRLSIALVALGVLREMAQSDGSEALVTFERAARQAFATKHNGTVFLEMVALPPDLRWSVAVPEAIERLANAPDLYDRRALYDEYVRLLGSDITNRAWAFSLLVFVMTPLDVSAFPDWLEHSNFDSKSRAEILRKLGKRYAKRSWLVDRYQAAALLRASLALEEDAEARKLLQATTDELTLVRTGQSGMRSFEQMPFRVLDLDLAVEDEMAQLHRLHALVAPK